VIVRRARVTGTARQVRVSAVSTQRGSVAITLRRAGKVIGSGRRSVRAGRPFTLKIGTRQKVQAGRYTLTTTLRPIHGPAWAASERIQLR
jgi:hypothetical protein